MTQTTDKLSTHVSVKEAEMAEVLAKIVRDKYQWVAARKQTQPSVSYTHLRAHET